MQDRSVTLLDKSRHRAHGAWQWRAHDPVPDRVQQPRRRRAGLRGDQIWSDPKSAPSAMVADHHRVVALQGRELSVDEGLRRLKRRARNVGNHGCAGELRAHQRRWRQPRRKPVPQARCMIISACAASRTRGRPARRESAVAPTSTNPPYDTAVTISTLRAGRVQAKRAPAARAATSAGGASHRRCNDFGWRRRTTLFQYP